MIAALQSEKFDGVVFDLLMHEISGDEAWRLAEEMFETLPPAVALSQTPVRDIPLLCTRLKIGDCINAAASAEQILERLISVQARNGAFEAPSSRASA
ncbi:hypothetical protein [Candidatus Viadribacter manganicus]|uniref:Response regulatory domain-containing protein n=1 Tax=Candidatus Viadribacter manganicus TaxID=1759059 RepID=A0A1B1AGI8_9PROT|nr:hypothetical protein [Candidatus Viadribacter manganicus]ANP45682.1 hypothetical protein ATE48_06980 [Candidatus Viadribacter manganicus]